MNLAKVWPLRPGLEGCNSSGQPIQLQPGLAGWMDYEKAIAAQHRGELQLMAGQTPQSLRTPVYETSEVRATDPDQKMDRPPERKSRRPPVKKTYSRRDVVAEKAGDS